MHGQRPCRQGCRPPWLPEPYLALWRSSSTQSELETAAGSRSPPAATEQQRKQLRSMLLDSFQTDPKGTSELMARTLDGRTQRVLLAAFAEQPALSRWVLVQQQLTARSSCGACARTSRKQAGLLYLLVAMQAGQTAWRLSTQCVQRFSRHSTARRTTGACPLTRLALGLRAHHPLVTPVPVLPHIHTLPQPGAAGIA